jgi:hypothetical protein
LISSSFLKAQTTDQDSIYSSVSIGGIISSDNFLPFLLEHNRWGEVNPDQKIFISSTNYYQHQFNDHWSVDGGFSFRNDRASEYYVRGRRNQIQLSVGAIKEVIGGIDSDLSLINYGISRNALPVPMVELKVDYIDVPFTNGLVKLKGSIAQRWLEDDRYQSKASIHNKDVYLMFDLDQSIGFQVSTGLVHIAQYAGTDPFGVEQPNAFSDWLDVFLGKGAAEGQGTAGENNGRGNHLGMFEIMFDKRIGEHRLTLDYQSPFEDGGSMQYISLKSFLLALNWKLPDSFSFLKEFQVEYTQSAHQSGPGIPDATPQFPTVDSNFGYKFGGRDDFHNNYLYRSGFTYKGRIMGNPLFHTYSWTQNFWEPYPFYEVAVSNNRIYALNFSARGEIIEKLSYRIQFVRTENYGSYKGLYDGRFNWGGVKSDPGYPYLYKGGLVQHFTSLELNWTLDLMGQPVQLTSLIGYDYGDMYDNIGAELSVSYLLLNK